LGDKLRRYLLVTIVLALVLSNILPVYAASTITPSEREITIIEKKVCFNVSISDPITNKTVSKTICVVIDFHIKNVKNGTITVSFPVTINIGNKTITKTVIVPLDVYGEVVKIEVYAGKEGSESKPEEVIYVVPQEEKTATTTTTKPTTTTATPKTSTPPRTTTSKPVTITKTKTITKTIEKKEIPIEMKDIALVIALIAIAVTLVFMLLKRRPREERKEEKPREEEISKEDYEEALRLLKQRLEEREEEIEKLKKSFPYTLICPSCGNRVKPVITDDNRLLCPVCHGEIARIKPDGTLEFPSEERGKNGILREGRARDNEEKTRENEGGTREKTGRGEQED